MQENASGAWWFLLASVLIILVIVAWLVGTQVFAPLMAALHALPFAS